MSHSGSRSPTHNPATSDIIKSPQQTTSRPKIQDEIPSERPLADRGRPPVTSHFSSPPPALGPQIAESSTRRRPTPESSTEKPMAKRIRRDSPETRGRASRHPLSSSSGSQDEMAVERVERPEPFAPTMTPPKKKRTRTLTTPQQSAVLHALLAKSRFPTTAMREDVGRSIGLSARKVQIWFQNQRQKARRPRSQSDAPLTRPPQYGPFPNPPGLSSSARGFEGYPAAHMSYTAQSTTPEAQSSQSDTSARLLGPGMPGPALYPPHTYQPMSMPSTSALPIESRFPGSHTTPQGSESPQYYRSPRASSLTNVRSTTSQPSSWHQRDPLRTLPPLLPRSGYSTRRAHSPSPYMPSRRAYGPPHPISPEPRYRISPENTSRPSMSLPPPFTMQPSPQWNQASFQSVPRPISSPWSRADSHSTIERSTSAVAARREHTMVSSTSDLSEGHHHLERTTPTLHSSPPHFIPPSSSAPPSRPGRYDPVRATFITRSTPTLPRVMSPAPQSGNDSEKEIHDDRKPHTPPRENR